MKLSIIIPVFNEEKSIITVIKRVQAIKDIAITKEIIVIDDGSTDKTQTAVREYMKISKEKDIRFFSHVKNQGKGAAVVTGMRHATGEYIIIQDADLEYDPSCIPMLIKPIIEKKTNVVYGTRLNRFPHFWKEEKGPIFILHYAGNRFLSLVTSLLYGQWITDMETCYKVFPKSVITNIDFISKGFEFEPEITSKLLKRGYKITEIPITTKPRGYKEGKKLNAIKEGPKALWILLKYRFMH